jgi:hypothetical protein
MRAGKYHPMKESAQVTAPGAITSMIAAISTRPNKPNRSTCSRIWLSIALAPQLSCEPAHVCWFLEVRRTALQGGRAQLRSVARPWRVTECVPWSESGRPHPPVMRSWLRRGRTIGLAAPDPAPDSTSRGRAFVCGQRSPGRRVGRLSAGVPARVRRARPLCSVHRATAKMPGGSTNYFTARKSHWPAKPSRRA